jgi:hypothetical protein
MKNRMNICLVDLGHAKTTKITTNKTKIIQDYLGGIYIYPLLYTEYSGS